VIHHLGDERYGIWALVFSLVDYYALVDFGFRSAVVKYVAHFRATGEMNRLETLISTGLAYFSLAAIAVLGARDKDLGIRIEPTWFIQMLNSLAWSDRTRAAAALVALTEERRPYVLDQIRETALHSLAEMARWKTLDHALPAFLVLGRVAGVPEVAIQTEWTRGDRQAFIEGALKSEPK